MRRWALVLAVLLVCANTVDAQISCGTVTNVLQTWQPPDLKYIETIAQTRRDYNICPIQLQVESWVDGVSGSVAVDRQAYVAEGHDAAMRYAKHADLGGHLQQRLST